MVRVGRERIAAFRAHRARQGSLPFPSSPACPPGHCGREGRRGWCGPGRAAVRFGGAGAQRRRRRAGSGALEAPAPLPAPSAPLRARLGARRFPRVLPAERAGLKWLICAFHAALPAPPLCSEEGKAGACVGGLWEWHAEAQRPPYQRGLLRSSNKWRCAGASCRCAVGGQLLVGLQRSSMSAWFLLQSSWLRP